MSEREFPVPVSSAPSADPVHPGLGVTANRRDVLKTGAGLVAAAAVGGAFLASGTSASAEEGAEEFEPELYDMAANAFSPNRIVVKIDQEHGFVADSFSFGVANTYDWSGGGPISGRAELSNVTITKYINGITPSLQLWTLNGRHHQQVVISMFRDNREIGRYTLEDVVIVGSELSYGGGDPSMMVEAVTFVFTEITMEFGKREYSWNRQTNTGA